MAETATDQVAGHIKIGAGLSVANGVLSHPSTAGSKHIPSGGAAGQILGWSADGTAQWLDSTYLTRCST